LNFGSQHVVMFCSTDIMYLEEHIGDYTIEFFLDGEIADDCLDFGDKTLRDYRIWKIKHNLRIVRISLRKGDDYAITVSWWNPIKGELGT
ncbi:hypothetical protein SB767_31190, partial [Bacillus sp. SIMBA_069]